MGPSQGTRLARLLAKINAFNGEGTRVPGRWIGGAAMVLGPVLLLVGVLLRIPANSFLAEQQLPFAFPGQLAAFGERPTLMVAAHTAYVVGNVLMWPAIVALAGLIGARRPGWALWGGVLTISGLFVRAFHAGVDWFAFNLVRARDLELATRAVADSYREISYGGFGVMYVLSFAILFGWILLAIGAYRSGTLGLPRSVALGLMALLSIGVLKATDATSVIAVAGLCVALVPLGIRVLLGSVPTRSPWWHAFRP